jgi:hypothetical protein
MDLKKEVDDWLKKIGIDQLKPYDTGEISWALNLGEGIKDLEAAKIDAAMLILANYRLNVSHQMGMCFARVKYLEDRGPRDALSAERAKLNIIKPWHDALEAKIAVIKKIYDRRIRELNYASSSGR